jgi:hypothetical protein
VPGQSPPGIDSRRDRLGGVAACGGLFAAAVPGGPGPSIIDLPAPGCWTLRLSWSGHTDELRLRYVA